MYRFNFFFFFGESKYWQPTNTKYGQMNTQLHSPLNASKIKNKIFTKKIKKNSLTS